VRDSSGAVLPGVTVEASSPALIEKTKSTVTDGQGLYRIVDLRPGTYTITFTLSGFSTLRRDAVDLPSEFTATINAELAVGALEETLTVTGESPVVDVQSANRERVLTAEVINNAPVNRYPSFMAAMIPGVNNSTVDVGGNTGSPTTGGGAGHVGGMGTGTGRGRGTEAPGGVGGSGDSSGIGRMGGELTGGTGGQGLPRPSDVTGTGGGVAVSGGRGSDVGTVGGGMEDELSPGTTGGMSGGTMGGSRESDLGGGLSGGMRSGMGTDASGGIGGSDDETVEGDKQRSRRRAKK
jgi:hypothetical protein